jgi:CRP/FNR family transcriptional regulator, cyclic AMP receptor protein
MLNNIKVFRDLDEESSKAVERYVIWRHYKKNDVVLNHKDDTNRVYLISSGSVKATRFSFSGKEIAYQTLAAGEIFGEIAAIDGGFRTTSIICAEESEIGTVSADDFARILETYPTVTRGVMLRLTNLIRFLCSRVYEYSALDVKDRVRAEIIRHARLSLESGIGATVKNMPTHEEIANKISTHREAVTKEFSFLTKAGLIEKQGRELIVPDIKKLLDMISEEI